MTLHEATTKLASLQAAINEMSTLRDLVIIKELFALIETYNFIALNLTEKVQAQKDEINRLKGEHGKAAIKGSTRGSFSSEEDRAAAESKTSPPPAIGFRLTKNKLMALEEDRIPADILEKLSGIKGVAYSSEAEFMEAILTLIGEKQAERYGVILLKHGLYKKRNRKNKLVEIKIDRTEVCKIDHSILPDDAVFSGYEDNVVQDIIIKSDNVKFLKEVYYSKSQKKTFMAHVPVGWEGGYGPQIKEEILCMKYVNNMSEPKILEALRSHNLIISGTYISNRLTSPTFMKSFLGEKEDLFSAALEVSSYHQIDDTGCRVNGVNQYCHILCNETYSAFFTLPRKDRLTILDILRNFRPRRYIFNDNTFGFLELFNVSNATIRNVRAEAGTGCYDDDQLQALLSKLFPDPTKGKNTKRRIAEAAAIAHYHQDSDCDVISILVADDAPQFKLLTFFLALCWIHIGRHFKKLNPIVEANRESLESFQNAFWKYYSKLRTYQNDPETFDVNTLDKEFDTLFSTKTGYVELDERIEKTKKKKLELLVVLNNPEIPLHNNRSENGARVEKRRQDVSLQTKSENGTKSKDAMMSIVETAKKLGINARELVRDRIRKLGKIPRLGDIIRGLPQT